MFKLLFLFLFSITLYANTFSIASYNVENFFDLNKDNTEYNEFVPNTKTAWNQKNFNIKVNNLVKVLKDIDADIIALQEVENRELMQLLVKKLPAYNYYSFIKYPDSAIGVGFLSKIKIILKKNHPIIEKFIRR